MGGAGQRAGGREDDGWVGGWVGGRAHLHGRENTTAWVADRPAGGCRAGAPDGPGGVRARPPSLPAASPGTKSARPAATASRTLGPMKYAVWRMCSLRGGQCVPAGGVAGRAGSQRLRRWRAASSAPVLPRCPVRPLTPGSPRSSPVRRVHIGRRPQGQQVRHLAARQRDAAPHQRLHQQRRLRGAAAHLEAVRARRDGLHAASGSARQEPSA